MIWVLGIIIILIITFVILKLTLNTKDNPDSNLGILEHPSTFKKQKIEHVDTSFSEKECLTDSDFKLTKENE